VGAADQNDPAGASIDRPSSRTGRSGKMLSDASGLCGRALFGGRCPAIRGGSRRQRRRSGGLDWKRGKAHTAAMGIGQPRGKAIPAPPVAARPQLGGGPFARELVPIRVAGCLGREGVNRLLSRGKNAQIAGKAQAGHTEHVSAVFTIGRKNSDRGNKRIFESLFQERIHRTGMFGVGSKYFSEKRRVNFF